MTRAHKYIILLFCFSAMACGPISPSTPKFAKAIVNSGSSGSGTKDLGERTVVGAVTETQKKPAISNDVKQVTSFDEAESFLKKLKKIEKKPYFELSVASLDDFLKTGTTAFQTSDLIRTKDIAGNELERLKENIEIHLLLTAADYNDNSSIEFLRRATPSIRVELSYLRLPSGNTWTLSFDKDIRDDDMNFIKNHTQTIIVIFNSNTKN